MTDCLVRFRTMVSSLDDLLPMLVATCSADDSRAVAARDTSARAQAAVRRGAVRASPKRDCLLTCSKHRSSSTDDIDSSTSTSLTDEVPSSRLSPADLDPRMAHCTDR